MPESGPSNERLADLRRRFDDDPLSPIFLQLAEEHRRLGQTEQGLKILEEGLRRNPSYLAAQVSYGRCLLEVGRSAAAVTALEQVLSKDPAQLVARKLLIEALVRQDQAVRARRELDLYISFNPSDPEVEGLRSRINDLQLADLVPPARLVQPPPAKPVSFADRLVLPTPRQTEERTGGDEEAQPIPGLPKRELGAHLRALAAEGVFPWPERAAEPSRSVLPVPTATLGQLYLAQGHRAEAEKIFQQVLAVDPNNQAARQGLESLAAPGLPLELSSPEPSAIELDFTEPSAMVPVEEEPMTAVLSAGDAAPTADTWKASANARLPEPSHVAALKAQALRRYLDGLRRTSRRHVSWATESD
jgi:cellulose synthase operon protein C